MVLAAPGVFRTTTQIDCALELLPSAKPLKHRAPVHFHAGTAEIEAQVRLLDGADSVAAGPARVGPHRAARAGAAAAGRPLHHPHVFAGGDDRRRRGGGHGGKRYRKADRQAWPSGCALSRKRPRRTASRCWCANRDTVMGMAELVARTGISGSAIAAAAANALVVVFRQPQRWFVDRAWFQSARREAAARGARVSSEEPAAARHRQAGSARPRTAGFAAVPDRRAFSRRKNRS